MTLKNIAQKITDLFKINKAEISGSIYLKKNEAIICKDVTDDLIQSTKIVADHIDLDADFPTEFPRFVVNKTTARIGAFGMHSKNVLVLDADDEPTAGSINLITSGTLYDVINNLQDQINELKAQLR